MESKNLNEILKKRFGHEKLTPLQKRVIETILDSRDCFAISPTGSGKSICYELPSIILDGITVVISPLLSLMKNQVEGLRKNGVKAFYYNSMLTKRQEKEVLQEASKDNIDILYVSPERFIKDIKWFETLNINLIAIDEAHSISFWGIDFRPEYKNLMVIKDRFPQIPILALTATATPNVRMDIKETLHINNCVEVIESFDRPNIELSVFTDCAKKDKIECIAKLYAKHRHSVGIVYCNTRRHAQSVANKLEFKKIPVKVYHAGMKIKERNAVQEEFQNGFQGVICATIAFGMGIDRKDVRWIVHNNTPQSIENYYQEIGRAGRDGKKSFAVLFHDEKDISILTTFANLSSEKEKHFTDIANIQRYVYTKECRRKFILNYFGEDYDSSRCKCDNCRKRDT